MLFVEIRCFVAELSFVVPVRFLSMPIVGISMCYKRISLLLRWGTIDLDGDFRIS
ncbi:unnamed protein product, partial [marine sediment metagenome]